MFLSSRTLGHFQRLQVKSATQIIFFTNNCEIVVSEFISVHCSPKALNCVFGFLKQGITVSMQHLCSAAGEFPRQRNSRSTFRNETAHNSKPT